MKVLTPVLITLFVVIIIVSLYFKDISSFLGWMNALMWYCMYKFAPQEDKE